MSNAASDISVRERDTSHRFKKLGVRVAREEKGKKERERERALQIKFYTEKKSSLLVRRKKLRLKILSWGRETLSAWKGGGRKLPQGKVEYEVNARNGERLKHSHQFLSSSLITDVASSMLIAIKVNSVYGTFAFCVPLF